MLRLLTGAVQLAAIDTTDRTIARQGCIERTVICGLLPLFGTAGEGADETETPVGTRIEKASEDSIANRRGRVTLFDTHAAHPLQNVRSGDPKDVQRDRPGRLPRRFDHAGNHSAISTQVFDHAANPDHVWSKFLQLRDHQEQFVRITRLCDKETLSGPRQRLLHEPLGVPERLVDDDTVVHAVPVEDVTVHDHHVSFRELFHNPELIDEGPHPVAARVAQSMMKCAAVNH